MCNILLTKKLDALQLGGANWTLPRGSWHLSRGRFWIFWISCVFSASNAHFFDFTNVFLMLCFFKAGMGGDTHCFFIFQKTLF